MRSRLDRWCLEPFRIFIPLGFLSSIIGVLLWPAALAGWLHYYPLEVHSRWMITGFGGCLIAGFLGTAGPRLIGASPWCRFELLWHGALCLLTLICLAFAQTTFADAFTGFWFLGILCSMLWRLLLERQDVPPPGFPLVFLGLLSGALAAFALALHAAIGFDLHWQKFWRLVYFQGLLWLPITGVAPYLLPRFFGLPSHHSFGESLNLPPKWKRHCAATLVAGLLLLASFAIEIWVTPSSGLIMRTAVVTLYLSLSIPGLVSFTKTNGLAFSLRWMIPSTACGWLLAAAYPHMRIGLSHFMFIGGPGLLMLAVSTRVILGHNDRHDRLASPLKWYHAIWVLLLLTASTRLSADFIPKVRTTHLIYAAILWVIIVALWAWKLRKESRIPRADDRERKSCPRRKRSAKSPAPSG